MFISSHSTAYGRLSQPHSVGIFDYCIQMFKKDPKLILWENVKALMQLRYGDERLGKFATDCGIGATTMTRIKQHQTSVGIDTIESIAKEFKLQPWQLLIDGLDVADPQTLGGIPGRWPFNRVTQADYEALSVDDRGLVQGYVTRLIEEKIIKPNQSFGT